MCTEMIVILLMLVVLVYVTMRPTYERFNVSKNGKCGPANGNVSCPKGQCCSSFGYCGGSHNTHSAWCPNYFKNTWKGGMSAYDG